MRRAFVVAVAALLSYGCGGGSKTDGGVDTVPPVVLSAVPAQGSSNVSVGQSMQVTFSERMNPDSVTFVAAPAVEFGTPTWSADTTVVTVPHATAFSFETSYTVTVNGRDPAGNALSPEYALTFTTEKVPDTAPPSVLTTAPANLATMVVTSSPITVTFSEAMRPSSVTVTTTPAIALSSASWANNDTEATWIPTAPLAVNQPYTVSVVGRDVAGNLMTAAYVFSFTTAPPPDTTPPTLVSSVPATGAASVEPGAKLSLTFSEAMNTTSLVIDATPEVALGPGAWSNGDTTVTFTAAPEWGSSTTYTLDLAGADVAGNLLAATALTFTTRAPHDVTPPTVESTSPASMATGVPVNTNLEFNFSEAMAGPVTELALSATPAISACTFTWNSAHTLMVCNPASNLAYSTTYTVRLAVGATDLEGNHLATQYEFTFTTASAPDTTRPTIVSTSPVTGSIGVARTAQLSVTFSEPMNKAATQAALQIVSPTGLNGGTFAWDRLGRTVTYTLPSTLAYGTTVSWQLTNVATDLAGNALAVTANLTFRVKRYTNQAFYATGTADAPMNDARAGYIASDTSCSQAVVYTHSEAVAGDRSSTTNPGLKTYRGFLTFDISDLSELTHVNITTAMLFAYQYYCYGNPYVSALGGTINAYHVAYGSSLDLGDCSTPILGGQFAVLSSTSAYAWKMAAVTASVVDDFNNRALRGNRSQFMLRTAIFGSNGDTVSDSCMFASHNYMSGYHPFLRIYYEYD